MSSAMDIAGQRFGKLTPIRPITGTKHSSRRWVCLCDCGEETTVRTAVLRNGHTTSCGCHGRSVTKTHGLTKTTEYRTWSTMKARCYRPGNIMYHRYGARGIAVCDRWRNSFAAFLEDMGHRPDGHSLDRIDNDGNYEPGNCRWASKTEQDNNRSTNVIVSIGDRTGTITQLYRAMRPPVSHQTVHTRIRKGWPVDKAFSVVPRSAEARYVGSMVSASKQ